MALVHADRVRETSTTTGTGTYNLAGAVGGFQTFVAGIGTGNTCYYCATDGVGWEVGIGTITDATPDTLARTSVLASSNAGAAVNWSAGTRTLFCTPAAGKFMGSDDIAAVYAPLASPALTGTPTSTTPSNANNNTRIATTAYVKNQAYAPLASPTFTGTPASVTFSNANNNTNIATTAFVKNTTTVGTMFFIIDGGGATITTGVKGDLGPFDFNFTINAVTLLADQSGSIVIDIWKDTYANYPPTVADTITASAKPTLSSATKSQDTTLTGWTATVAAGQTLRFNVDSITTCQRVALTMKYTRTF